MLKKWAGTIDSSLGSKDVENHLYNSVLGIDYDEHVVAYDRSLNRRLSQNALTVLRNKNNIIY